MPTNTSTNGFVLAGGKSRRMGRDKALLPWGDVSLLEHMTQLLSTVASRVQVVGRAEFPDIVSGKGPLGGILTALETTDRDANLFVAVDLPKLTPVFLDLFHTRFLQTSRPLLACRIRGRYPLCLGIRRRLAAALADCLREDRLTVRDFIEEMEPEILEGEELEALGIDPAIFSNINTPDDLTEFR